MSLQHSICRDCETVLYPDFCDQTYCPFYSTYLPDLPNLNLTNNNQIRSNHHDKTNKT
jgi:hypothetical protein